MKAIQLSKIELFYEEIPFKYRTKGKSHPKVFSKEQASVIAMDILLALAALAGRVLNWFYKLKGKREVLLGLILAIGLTPQPKVKALPLKPEVIPQLSDPIVTISPVLKVSGAVLIADTTLTELAPVAVPVPVGYVSGNMYSTGCGDNFYANYIYTHESGCNLNAVNSIGCRGIGQACPGSKLPCGADYVCQNEFFTNYANSAYGGWSGAYDHWLAYHWW